MADNYRKDDFEDIYSNAPAKSKFEVKIEEDDFQDISSFSENYVTKNAEAQNRQVRYNSSADNRRRQEYSFDDPSELYGSMIPEEPKRRKKKHTVLATISILLVLTIVFTGGIGIFAYSKVKHLVDCITVDEPLKDNEYISSSELYSNSEQINILLVGSDAREKDTNARSDTMILLTIDNKNGQLKLTSFLRDLYVDIANEKGSKNKLNASFSWGGIQMLRDTLELNFKVEIPYYVIVDFEVFQQIIDAIGGIKVEVTEKEAAYINYLRKTSVDVSKDFPEDIEMGNNYFNGAQALWYSRIRKWDSDFMRTQRQRKVIEAIVEKAKTCDISELYEIAEEILPLVRTNIPSDDTMKIGTDAIIKGAYKYPIVQHQVPADETWDNASHKNVGATVDFKTGTPDENAKLLKDFLKNKQDTNKDTDK